MTTNNDIIQEKIYRLRAKKKAGAVLELYFAATNNEEASKKAKKFCLKHNMRHIYTKPFLTDLESWVSL